MSNTTERIRVLLDWDADAKHAILWAADKAGLFGQNGLEVEVVKPGPHSLEKVQAGEVELAINYPHNILLMRKELGSLISVGALVKTNPEGLLCLKTSGIAAPKDLKNKRIAIGTSPLGKSQIAIFLSHHGLTGQVELIPVGRNGRPLLISGEFDVLNEVRYAIPRVQRKGYETVFFPYINSGVPDSAFLVFTGQEAWVAGHTEELKRFFACLREGLKLVKSWEDEQWKSYTAALEGRNGDEERAVWKTILPMIDDGGGLFQHNIEEIRKLQDILCANGLLDTPYPVEEIFVNTHV